MLNSSLTELLKLFTKEEMKSFADYVNSPFFNKKSSITKFLKSISGFYPDFNDKSLGRDILWKSLYPSKPYNYGVMKNLIHDLTKLAEDFASQSRIKKNQSLHQSELLKFLCSKDNQKLISKYSERITKEKNDILVNNLFDEFEIEKTKAQIFYSFLSDRQKAEPKGEFDFATELLLTTFLSELFEHYAMINEVNKIHKVNIETPLLEEALGFVESNDKFLKHEKISAYYYLLMSEKKSRSGYFTKALKILTDMSNDGDPRFLYYLWVNLANNLAFRFHEGDKSAQRELFELNKLIIGKGICHPERKNKIYAVNFNTIYNIAASEKEYEWAYEFVNQHYILLEQDFREDMRNRCLADLSFRSKDFEATINHLSNIKKIPDPHMKIYVKMLTVMSYYELGYLESSLSVLDAFKHLLKNEKRLQEVIRKKYEKFIRGFTLLVSARQGDKSAAEKFRMYVEKTDGITSLSWLLRKAQELDSS
jgi:hypothetical protein